MTSAELGIGAVILWIVPIFVAAAIGKPKNRPGVMYGLFLGWIGVIILALIPPLRALSPQEQLAWMETRGRGQYSAKHVEQEAARLRAIIDNAPSHRDCPFCREQMRWDATVCPHCQRDSAPALA